jgi:hypothetical protein
LSENKSVKKFLVAIVLLVTPLFNYAQTPPPSFPSGADAFNASPIPMPKKVDSEKEKLIRSLLSRTREAEMAEARMLQAMAGMKQMMPRVPEKYWDKYRSLISVEELQNRLVAVYDKYYTTEEVTGLLQFYDSPIGKKLGEKAVPILRDSMEIAQKMSQRAAAAVASDVQAEQLLQQPRAAGSFSGILPAPSSSATPAPSTPTPAPQ